MIHPLSIQNVPPSILSSEFIHLALGAIFGYQENDETLYEHRKGNSAKLLLLKSLLSQSVPALVIASAMDDVLPRVLKQKTGSGGRDIQKRHERLGLFSGK